ncbi:Fe(3+)-siderophore ABC transporter permease [Erwiniaceae bacterium BAC15a-03b]|uniref:Fe(3+)-siderophore ABC transporter permease n=1 Tax=Winslowiella arboricola TaxID=2978220 RepID=A0A9J6PQS9_9GAMM|nr:Fe(3+)-siderophore ABC transporter permease [Winslowiella arboricola]MCU5772564.1 Fe(3+)-siderophore ABC transporter permease [Winslowiella arboricola]MCU5779086.1 Fe(3+)-siderophore ABC transporter permease [Winslowiella arboricola]
MTQYSTQRQLSLLGVILLLLLLCCGASMLLGAKTISPADVWHSLTGQLQNADSVIIVDARLPRTIAGILAGLALGGAGAVIQALTRNPLADPGILGVNAGASFAIAIGISLFGVSGMAGWLGFAWGGALLASIAVWLIGSLGGGRVNPVRLTLAGVALSAVLTGMTTSLALLNPQTFDQMRIWQAGTLDIRSLHNLRFIAPAITVGCLLALLSARALNSLSMGEEMAAALGTRVLLVRLLAVVAVMLLCGSTTALVGPIAFVGLMIPHVARWWFGSDQRWILLASFLLAPVLLLTADITGRLLVAGELRVSIVTAFIGAPVLIWLVRQHKY